MGPASGTGDDARGDARTTAIRAFQDARRAGDVGQMAEAALRLPFVLEFGVYPGQVPALVYEAYAAVTEPALRGRLAAALGRAWVYGGDPHRARGFAAEAVEVADRLGDPEQLADALDAAVLTRWGPDDFTERLALSARLGDVTAHLSAVEPKLSALLWRLTTAWECLDVVAVQRQLRALDVLAEESGSTRVAFFAVARRAMAVLVWGELADADRLIARTREIGDEAAEPDLLAVTRSLLADRARRTGDRPALAEEAARFEAYGTAQGIPSVNAEAAVLWLEAGQPGRALTLLHQLVGPGLDLIARDVDFLLTVTSLVRVAAALEAKDIARDGVRLLEPYAGRAVLNAGAVSFHGVVDHYLYRALELVDPPRAVGRQHSAASCYRRIGAVWWSEQVAGPRASPPLPPSTLVGHFRRESDGTWSIGWDETTATLPDARGLQYLHHLLQHPGTPVAATDLSAAASGHPGPARLDADTSEVIDATALAAYRQRLTDIEDDLEEARAWADEARTERLEAERDALLDEVRAATGLGGRRRRFTSNDERARVAVRKAIVAGLDRIERHDPAFARQLRDAVHTGSTCSYDPDPHRPITWHL
jgi:hypothetical protein